MKTVNLKLTENEAKYLCDVLSELPIKSGFFNNLLKKIGRAKDSVSKRITVRSAKNKGMEFQKKVCEMISQNINVPYNQSDDQCDIHARNSGLNGVDIILRGKAAQRFPFSVECKAQENLRIQEWIRQAMDNIEDGRDWLLVFKTKALGSKPIAVLDFDRFLVQYACAC